MSLLATITNSLGGGILSGVRDIIRSFKMPPEELAKAELALLHEEQRMGLALLEAERSIIVAEAHSESWLTRTWRPATMLTFVGLIVARWMGFTAPGITEQMEVELLSLVKIGLGGYVASRGLEKLAPTAVSVARALKGRE